MFNYNFVINVDTMEVSIVPSLSSEVVPSESQQRYISYPNSKYPDERLDHPLFFEIESKLFPSYLRCENFPWERLSNLQEALHFKEMYDQYNSFTKTKKDVFYFDSTDLSEFRTNNSFISCSCLCSEEFKVEFNNFRFNHDFI